jgi:hypothetical protein
MKLFSEIFFAVCIVFIGTSRLSAQNMNDILSNHLKVVKFAKRTKLSKIEIKGKSIPMDKTKVIPYEIKIDFPEKYEVNYFVRGIKQSIQCVNDSCYSTHRDETDSVITKLSDDGIDRIWMKEAINRGYLFYNQEYLVDIKLLKNMIIDDDEFFRFEYSCDKYRIIYYLGVNDYLVHKIDYLFNDTTNVKVVFSKHKKVNGLIFPVQKEIFYNNKLSSKIIFNRIKIQ